MEILEDPVFKTEYQKYKIRVKLWESRFTEKHGRKPNKNDIKEADMKIKESYKMYWKLKTRALEETFTDISFSDEREETTPIKSEIETSPKEIKETEEVKDNDKSLRNNNEQVLEDMYENKQKNIKGVWGDHLSKSNEQVRKKKQTSLLNRSSSFQLSQNKFTSSSFTKRNPRKSLSTTKIKIKSEKDNDNNTIESNSNVEENNEEGLDVNQETKSMFDESSVKVTFVDFKSTVQSIGTLQQLSEGHIINRNLNSGWLDRCCKQNNVEYPAFDLQRLSGTSDSGVESMESSIRSPAKTFASESQNPPQISDEEDFICNSDSEEEHKNKRIRNCRKRFSDQETCPSKKICIENNTDALKLNTIDMQPMHFSSEEKCNSLNITNVAVSKGNIINNNVNNQTKLAIDTDKFPDKVKNVLEIVNTNIDDEENIEKSSKKESITHKIQRKMKCVTSDDLDPDFNDFNDSNIKETKGKKKVPKTKQTSTRKNKTTKGSTSTNKTKTKVRTKRSTRKKMDLEDEEDVLETGKQDLETTKDKRSEIYGIETLQTVPRFAMCKSTQGDLIKQFAKSVSSKTDDLSSSTVLVPAKSKGKLTDKEKLEKKVVDGNINDNFVRINLKRKVFVRGKKHFNFSKYRKNQWKERKKQLGSSEGSLEVVDFIEKKGVSTCFKCGNVGHFSRNCPNGKGDDLMPLNEMDDDSEFPTLEEAQKMASQNAIVAHANRMDRLPEKPLYSFETNSESIENKMEDKNVDDDLWEHIENDLFFFYSTVVIISYFIKFLNVNNPEKSNNKLSPIAEAYHAGLSAYRRKIVQKAFMNGQTRIVVATVAFGMGLNKPDIRVVIHYNMPGTFEGYVQEVGRAGRDGLLAHCHLFLSPTEDNDKWELRRHIYANGVDRHTIRRLLQNVFVPCSCAKLREKNANCRCPGHEVAIPVDETVAALDISEQSISTLLCYLELHPKRFITVLSSVYVRAKVSSYGGPQALKQAAQTSPPLAMAIAMDLQNGISHENDSVIEFPVVDVASAIGWDSGVVKNHLKSLEWKTVNGIPKRSVISVKYDTLGLRVKAPGDLTEMEQDEALDALFSRAQSQETSALRQLETIGITLHKFSVPSVKECLTLTDEMTNNSDKLKDVVRDYFDGKVLFDIDCKQQNKMENEAQIACDVRNLVLSYRDNNFTGRAVARIFHGIQSPNYPAYVWNKSRFWRAYLSYNFNTLCQIATREILALR
ncbi:ATP-dependent DNA helicase Q4 [Eufriesea mexicana]|uniref:DNA 3'-5' helicase n=1 Tax=Eufriesea mexicana TaxID=516756 RepID=A0A310SJZ3_9HYME|nr:ATP-dependent DNA helicase Q4 [Eufriesea mexicana]